MNTRRFSTLVSISCFALLLGAGVAWAAAAGAPAEKVVVIDGHVVHDVNQIGNNVTNWGMIGSTPGASAIWSDSPSAQWPIWSGDEYLWAAGLWVGGVVLGEQLVSTGSFFSEFRPTEAEADTIYRTAHGAVGGNRFPWPDADDDLDGREDEELLNGLDDDGDGMVDEDFAAIGDQHFVCGYNDHDPSLQEILPDHTPLPIEVVQQSIAWSDAAAEDFIGYDFTVTNVGVVTIEDVYLGLFSDCDIGPRGRDGVAQNDYAGFVSTTAQTAKGTEVPVQIAYMYDGDPGLRLDGYVGWVLCGHTTDPAGVNAPAEPGVCSFQRFSGQAAFDQGGDPQNDSERYAALSEGSWDADAAPGQADDYRVLTAAGPFAGLAPGESLSYQVALVLGDGLDDMIANAAEAVAAYRGLSYDRDEDPSNGDEFTVRWLLEDEAPVAAGAGWITARIVPDGVRLQVETNPEVGAAFAVVRRVLSGPGAASERRWSAAELTALGYEGQRRLYQLLDTDDVGWPRRYVLRHEWAGGSLALNNVSLDLPRPAALALSASPNPFNPRVSIRFSLPRAGHLQLQIFDLRGRLVRTLIDEHRDAGADAIVWSGDDDGGRAVGSGVYQVRLSAENGLAQESVTLVR